MFKWLRKKSFVMPTLQHKYQVWIACDTSCQNYKAEPYRADSFEDPDEAIEHANMCRDIEHWAWVEINK